MATGPALEMHSSRKVSQGFEEGHQEASEEQPSPGQQLCGGGVCMCVCLSVYLYVYMCLCACLCEHVHVR